MASATETGVLNFIKFNFKTNLNRYMWLVILDSMAIEA